MVSTTYGRGERLMVSSKEEIFAIQEISGNVKKLAEFNQKRAMEAKKAVKAYNEITKDFETFKTNWKKFDQEILQGVIDACDLADAEIAIEYYYNLMYQMHDDPESKIVIHLFYVLAEEISQQLNKSSQEWAKLTAKREDVTYDLYQKEIYLKEESKYWESEQGDGK